MRLLQQNGRNLTKSMLMYPIFISDDPDAEQIIQSLPGQKRWGINKLEGFLAPLVKKGLKSLILFGVPEKMQKVCLRRIFRSVEMALTLVVVGRERKSSGRSEYPCHPRSAASHQIIPPTSPRSRCLLVRIHFSRTLRYPLLPP